MEKDTLFQRPVQGADLLAWPEMALRSPGEVELELTSVDEGVGTGYDNMNPMAYAERVFTLDDAGDLFGWYTSVLHALGWETRGEARLESLSFTRGSAESIQVQVLPFQDGWTRHYDTDGVICRVAFSVAGSWPADHGPSKPAEG